MDAFFLAKAIELAKFASLLGEVPVAAIIVFENRVIGRGINLKETLQQPASHAEMMAIQQAATVLGTWRLQQTVMYSSLEPCPMCAGAILQARIPKLVFAAKDLRWGAAGTQYNLLQDPQFNHQVELSYQPVTQASSLLKQFFKTRRMQ